VALPRRGETWHCRSTAKEMIAWPQVR
jgi:hypothetical protein